MSDRGQIDALLCNLSDRLMKSLERGARNPTRQDIRTAAQCVNELRGWRQATACPKKVRDAVRALYDGELTDECLKREPTLN